MSPRRYTELFFLDEAVALAAGHRPCAECRRDRYRAFLAAWMAGGGHAGPTPKAPELDAALHAARLDPATRRQHTFRTELAGLPDSVFIRLEDRPLLVLGDRLLPWAPGGYGDAIARPSGGPVRVLTPRPAVAAMAAGYRPELHASATGACTAVSFRHAGQDR